MKIFICIARYTGIVLLALAYLLYALWCFGAICYAPVPFFLRAVFAFIFLVLILMAPFVKPKRCFIPAGIALMILISGLWTLIKPTNDKVWRVQYAKLPVFSWKASGREVVVQNLRDFRYPNGENAPIVKYVPDMTLSLDNLESMEYAVVHWKNPLGMAVAHSMLCFRFKGGTGIVFSCETRADTKQSGDRGIPGIYKQFNLIYVAGTEADLFGVRTNCRAPREDLYLYQTNATKEQMEIIFKDLTVKADNLNREPEFYNTLTANCMTSLLYSIRKAVDIPFFSKAYLLNGFSDRTAYDLGFLKLDYDGQTFEDLRESSHVNPFVDHLPPSLPNAEEYSRLLRSGKGTVKK